jgi:hypothetical protein
MLAWRSVTRRILPILLAVVMSLACAAPAMARQLNLGERVVADYIKNGGRIDACMFTQDQLKQVKDAIPEDLKQYGASLIAALDDAIAARAQGACNKKSQAQAPPVAGQTAPPGAQSPPPAAGGVGGHPAPGRPSPAAPAQVQAPPTPTSEPSPVAAIADDDSIALASNSTDAATDAPFPMLALAILAALLALCAVTFGVVRWFAWEPAWTMRVRHAAGEAGWRASSTWSEFADFVRLGR